MRDSGGPNPISSRKLGRSNRFADRHDQKYSLSQARMSGVKDRPSPFGDYHLKDFQIPGTSLI
jgi:hypothetical protein